MPNLPKLDTKWTCLVCRCDQTSGRRCRVISRDQGQMTLFHATEIARIYYAERVPPQCDELKFEAIGEILDEVYDDVICEACDVERNDLALEVKNLRSQLTAMRETRDQSCSCAIGNGSAPLVAHHKNCALRVNLRKRIDPALAMSRLAQALDSEEQTTETIAAWLDEWDPTCGEAIELLPEIRFLYGDPDVGADTKLHAAPNLSFENFCLLVMAAIRAGRWRTP